MTHLAKGRRGPFLTAFELTTLLTDELGMKALAVTLVAAKAKMSNSFFIIIIVSEKSTSYCLVSQSGTGCPHTPPPANFEQLAVAQTPMKPYVAKFAFFASNTNV